MKRGISIFLGLSSACLAALTVACKAKPVDASQPLQQSFDSAEPAVKQAAQTAAASLKSGNYTEATRALAPVLDRPLTAPQNQAINMALQQINTEIARNPSLDTKEMYELRLKMHQAVDGGKRF